MGCLGGPRIKRCVADRVTLALKGDALLGHQAAHDLDALAQAQTALIARNIETCKFAGYVTLPETQIETAVRERVDRYRLLGDVQRFMQGHQEDKRADADSFGPRGDRGRERHHRGRIAVIDKMMFGEPNRVETEILGLDTEINVLAIKLGI